MSADRWSHCPQCRFNDEDQKSILADKMDREYGQVSRAVFQGYLDTMEEIEKRVHTETLGQYWELGIKDGTTEFYVGFSAECSQCGYSFHFNHNETLRMSQ